MSPFNLNLAGGHVLVTGGSKGIGRAIVQAFLDEGINVSFCARAITGNEFSSFQKDSSSSVKAIGTAVDISVSSQIQEWVEKAVKELGPIDAVVANASPLIHAPTVEAWQQSFQADILGLLALIAATLPHLEKRATDVKSTSIVVISSLAGFETRHPAIGGPYATFKRAQATIAKDYARQFAPKNVRINTIVPGSIEIPGTTNPDGTVELSSFQIVKRDCPEFYDELLKAVPINRMGRGEEIASAVLFLSSNLASYVTGANWVVDGGMSIFL